MRWRGRLNTFISTTTRLNAIKRSKVMNYYEGLLSIKLRKLLNIWSFEITWQIKAFYLHASATKVSTAVTLVEGVPTLKSHDHLNKCLCEVMWQIKKKLNLSTIPMVTKLVSVVTYCEKVIWPYMKHMILSFWFSVIWFIGLERQLLNRHWHLVMM